MHLRLSQRRVDELAAVVDVHDVQQLDFAHRDIDFDLGECAAEGIGVVADGVSRFRCEVLGMDGVILRGHGQLGQAHQHAAVGDADDVGVDDVHVISSLPRELAGVFEDLPLQQLGRLPDGEACRKGLAGGVSAEARRGHVGVLTGQNVYLFIIGQAKDLRAHLCVGCVCALTDLGFADL